jgi:diacylglycerol O-acyltransferase / wax synthase
VPGPQFPLYLLGRRLQVLYPVVPLAQRQALGIAVMSYDGHLGFGLLADYDALPDLETIALDLQWAIAALARAAGVRPPSTRSTRKPASPRATPARASTGRS